MAAHEPQSVAISILYVHFPGAPSLIEGAGVNSDFFRDEFGVQGIHVLNQQVDHTARDPSPEKEET